MREIKHTETNETAWIIETDEDLLNIYKECYDEFTPEDERSLKGILGLRPENVYLIFLGERCRPGNKNSYPLITFMSEAAFAVEYK